MKYLIKFNESSDNRTTLNVDNYGMLAKSLQKFGIFSYMPTQGSRNDNVKFQGLNAIIEDHVHYKNFVDSSKKLIVSDDPNVKIKFKYIGAANNTFNKLKSIYTNEITLDKKVIEIKISKDSLDDISQYKDIIEDTLVEFEDMGYKSINFIIGSSGQAYGDLQVDDFSYHNYSNAPYKTAYLIKIAIVSDTEEVEDEYDGYDVSYEYFIKTHNFIIKSDLPSKVNSCIKKLENKNFKVLFKFDNYYHFQLVVVCDKDANYNKIHKMF